jgi:hypothetical protein
MDRAAAIIMAIFGVILLLPGACAIYFMMGPSISDPAWARFFGFIWIVCLLISVGGIALLVQASRRKKWRPAPPDHKAPRSRHE